MRHKPKNKLVSTTVNRIRRMVESGNPDWDKIEHMVQSLVENKEKQIEYYKARSIPRQREFFVTEKAIAGALRSTINAHGPITKAWIASATKRLYGALNRFVEEKNLDKNTDTCYHGEKVREERTERTECHSPAAPSSHLS